jgi:hypothetical protein
MPKNETSLNFFTSETAWMIGKQSIRSFDGLPRFRRGHSHMHGCGSRIRVLASSIGKCRQCDGNAAGRSPGGECKISSVVVKGLDGNWCAAIRRNTPALCRQPVTRSIDASERKADCHLCDCQKYAVVVLDRKLNVRKARFGDWSADKCKRHLRLCKR